MASHIAPKGKKFRSEPSAGKSWLQFFGNGNLA